MRESSKLNINAFQFADTFAPNLTSVKTNFYFLIGLFAVFTIGIGLPFTREATRWVWMKTRSL